MTKEEDGDKAHRDYTDKRIQDLKWYIGIFSSAIAFLVAGLTVIGGLNLAAEKSSLKDFKQELREEVRESLGKSVAQPKLVFQTMDGKPLEGATLPAWIGPGDKNKPQIHFEYVIANKGNGRSGPMFQRFYASDIRLSDPDVDQTGYKYATFIKPENFNPAELLGGVAMKYISSLDVADDFHGFEGEKKMLLRLYYSNGITTQAEIKLRMKK
jgi:hypothetical protein